MPTIDDCTDRNSTSDDELVCRQRARGVLRMGVGMSVMGGIGSIVDTGDGSGMGAGGYVGVGINVSTGVGSGDDNGDGCSVD